MPVLVRGWKSTARVSESSIQKQTSLCLENRALFFLSKWKCSPGALQAKPLTSFKLNFQQAKGSKALNNDQTTAGQPEMGSSSVGNATISRASFSGSRYLFNVPLRQSNIGISSLPAPIPDKSADDFKGARAHLIADDIQMSRAFHFQVTFRSDHAYPSLCWLWRLFPCLPCAHSTMTSLCCAQLSQMGAFQPFPAHVI